MGEPVDFLPEKGIQEEVEQNRERETRSADILSGFSQAPGEASLWTTGSFSLSIPFLLKTDFFWSTNRPI